MALTAASWAGRRVLLTGHTGFKGGWLALWLQALGAQVRGYALPPHAAPSLWSAARLQERIPHGYGDVRDAGTLAAALGACEPEVVIHLAAQPLVRQSYRDPADSYATNVMGTVHLLEAVRQTPTVRAVLVVTSDKCYENREHARPYHEQDALGGSDPYSSSKACVEVLCHSWRQSFLQAAGIALATARAGNVIGGGDWSDDRLVPDVLRHWDTGRRLVLRYPQATRPFQHVLEPLHGYLLLAQALMEGRPGAAGAWNFGPDPEGHASVAEVIDRLARLWPDAPGWERDGQTQLHEAGLLALDSGHARRELGWQPRWSLQQGLERTLDWHRAWRAGADMQAFTLEQIQAYQSDLK